MGLECELMQIDFSGIDAITKDFEKLEVKTTSLAKSTLYEGAGVIADETKKALQNIPIDVQRKGSRAGYAPFIHQGSNGRKIVGVTPEQKKDIIDSLGITKMHEDSGFVNVRIGFDGYTVNGKGEGKVAIAELLRSFESGTSFIRKTPIVRQAFTRSRDKAIQAMQKHIDQVIRESFK